MTCRGTMIGDDDGHDPAPAEIRSTIGLIAATALRAAARFLVILVKGDDDGGVAGVAPDFRRHDLLHQTANLGIATADQPDGNSCPPWQSVRHARAIVIAHAVHVVALIGHDMGVVGERVGGEVGIQLAEIDKPLHPLVVRRPIHLGEIDEAVMLGGVKFLRQSFDRIGGGGPARHQRARRRKILEIAFPGEMAGPLS